MKKTFPVNINGSIFYIDEDAYNLLNTYLDQLRKAFPGDEGKEISSDIEGRIAEHFNERINAGATVIVLEDVNTVIDTMGRPSDLADSEGMGTAPDESAPKAEPDNKQGRGAATDGPQTPPPYPFAQPQAAPMKRLYRDERNKVFGGVLSGLGLYLGWNITMMRVLIVILALCTKLWPLVVLYMIAWMIIPPARTARQILEMTGSPVTINGLGQTILGTNDPNAASPTSGATTFFSIVGKVIMGFLGFVAGCVGLASVAVFFAAVCGTILYTGWDDLLLLDGLDVFDVDVATNPILGGIGAVLGALAVITPCLAIVWGACCALFNARGASRTLIILGIILEIVFIIGAIILLRLAVPHTADLYSLASSTLAATVPLQLC